jgi:hypothetical protein
VGVGVVFNHAQVLSIGGSDGPDAESGSF